MLSLIKTSHRAAEEAGGGERAPATARPTATIFSHPLSCLALPLLPETGGNWFLHFVFACLYVRAFGWRAGKRGSPAGARGGWLVCSWRYHANEGCVQVRRRTGDSREKEKPVRTAAGPIDNPSPDARAEQRRDAAQKHAYPECPSVCGAGAATFGPCFLLRPWIGIPCPQACVVRAFQLVDFSRALAGLHSAVVSAVIFSVICLTEVADLGFLKPRRSRQFGGTQNHGSSRSATGRKYEVEDGRRNCISRCPGESESPVSEIAVHESRGGVLPSARPTQRPQQQRQPQQRQQRGHSRGGSFLGAVGSPAVISSRMSPCPVEVQDNRGTVESPNFPDTYPPNTDCFSVLRVKPGDVVALKFETLFMERNPRCSSDYVEIFDGATFDSPSLGRFCRENQKSSLELRSTGNAMAVHFHSDDIVNLQGFRARYHGYNELEEQHAEPSNCRVWTEDSRGFISSPNYPDAYPPNSSCRVPLDAGPQNIITLYIVDIQLDPYKDCPYDKIEVRDGANEDAYLLGRFCGAQGEPEVVSSSGREMFLFFNSDSYLSGRGFKAEFRVHKKPLASPRQTTVPLKKAIWVKASPPSARREHLNGVNTRGASLAHVH
ncbi:hypothetical protein HPB51_005280 [Rhipicephalus microplus]|uniref:CUB domain-containing protein n=1 Tax=Rhipicephalus microplus TaxID=6941 RepID=A0A9J6DFE1_RHIMP|nr:hypothetical protein HPB51_005280 [Rhipicephalus microplus]